MLRLLNIPGIIEAKFKKGFMTYNVVIDVNPSKDGTTCLISVPLLPNYRHYLEDQRKHISVVENIKGQITGFKFWDFCAVGYMELFIPFGKVKFVCHYPSQYYKPQTIIGYVKN